MASRLVGLDPKKKAPPEDRNRSPRAVRAATASEYIWKECPWDEFGMAFQLAHCLGGPHLLDIHPRKSLQDLLALGPWDDVPQRERQLCHDLNTTMEWTSWHSPS